MTDAELDKYKDDAAIKVMAENMMQRNIKFSIKESKHPVTGETIKAIVVDEIPNDEKQAMLFFTESGLPIPGAAKLKERYNKELKLLNERSETGTCMPCQKGALTREYLPLVRKLIAANNKVRENSLNDAINEVTEPKQKQITHQETNYEEQNTDTGIVELPGASGPSTEGDKKRESVLRRAKRYIEKILSISKRETEE